MIGPVLPEPDLLHQSRIYSIRREQISPVAHLLQPKQTWPMAHTQDDDALLHERQTGANMIATCCEPYYCFVTSA